MSLFEQKVVRYGPRFKRDLGLIDEHVSGLFGNFAVETDAFTALQEKNPVVRGSRGGWGWSQWTGPRRRAFERWADQHKYDRSADETNYLYVVHEMRTVEARALEMLKRTRTAADAAIAVMKYYERPGIPHQEKRIQWAERALRTLRNVKPTKKPTTSTTNWSALGALGSAILAAISNPYVQVAALVLAAGFVWWIIRERNKRLAYDASRIDDDLSVGDEAAFVPDTERGPESLRDQDEHGRSENPGEVSSPDGDDASRVGDEGADQPKVD